MCKVISLYNHKGGVSKTTTTFNLGWALADSGYRVGMVDLDPQCNLTALTLGLSEFEDFIQFYNTKGNEDIYEKLQSILSGETINIEPVNLTKTNHENLFLVAGNIGLSNVDIELTLGLASNQFTSYAKQFVGALNSIIRETAKRNELDYVLLDMSPSSGGMNRIVLMGSDFFIIPTSPDFFCYQAIQGLGKVLPEWNKLVEEFRNPKIKNSLPKTPPKMLGIISQKYNRYSKKMAKSYRDWTDKIQKASYEILAENLKNYDMVISEEKFKEVVKDNSPYNIINVPDFQSLIAISQDESTPVFTITDEHLENAGKHGNVKDNMMKNIEEFKELFQKFAEIIDKLTN
ncbi:MAG: AAA family ATPase [Candidatus Muiribacteriota bacterium]